MSQFPVFLYFPHQFFVFALRIETSFVNILSVNPTKMVKNTQKICRLLATICLSVFGDFVGLVFKALTFCCGCLIIYME